MLASFIDGRIRLRDPALKKESVLENLTALAQSQEGVHNVTANPKTGSVLIEYDPGIISRERLLEAAGMLESVAEQARLANPGSGTPCRKTYRQCENAALGGLFAMTVLSLMFGKRIHTALGAACTVLALKHAFERRRCF